MQANTSKDMEHKEPMHDRHSRLIARRYNRLKWRGTRCLQLAGIFSISRSKHDEQRLPALTTSATYSYPADKHP
jgi:hypothetical protein